MTNIYNILQLVQEHNTYVYDVETGYYVQYVDEVT